MEETKYESAENLADKLETEFKQAKEEERSGPSKEVLEKIGLRTNKILATFFSSIRDQEEEAKNAEGVNQQEQSQIEASALMQSAAAIATSVIFSIHNQGIALNQLLEDHIRGVKIFLAQAEQREQADVGDQNEKIMDSDGQTTAST